VHVEALAINQAKYIFILIVGIAHAANKNINSFLTDFRGKKLKPQRSSKKFFPLQTHLKTYENLYSF